MRCRLGESRWPLHTITEHFHEVAVSIHRHSCLAPTTVEHEETKWQVVEQFICDHHAMLDRGRHFTHAVHRVGVLTPLFCGELDCDVRPGSQTLGLCGDHRPSQGSRACTNLDHHEIVRASQLAPPFIECSCQYCTEEWAHLGRSDEVAAPPRRSHVRVEAVLTVESKRHEVAKTDRSGALYRATDFVSRRRHRRFGPCRRNAVRRPATHQRPAWPPPKSSGQGRSKRDS